MLTLSLALKQVIPDFCDFRTTISCHSWCCGSGIQKGLGWMIGLWSVWQQLGLQDPLKSDFSICIWGLGAAWPLSLSPAPHLLGLLCAAGASHGPCSQGSRTPVLALLVQAKPGAHPRHLAGKSSRGPVYIHGKGKENPFPHGRGVKVFTAFFNSPCLAYYYYYYYYYFFFFSSFSFWDLLRIQWSL